MRKLNYPKFTLLKRKNRFIEFWLSDNLKSINSKAIQINCITCEIEKTFEEEINFIEKKYLRLISNLSKLDKVMAGLRNDRIVNLSKKLKDDKILKSAFAINLKTKLIPDARKIINDIEINFKDISQLKEINWSTLNFIIISCYLKKERATDFDLSMKKSSYKLRERNVIPYEFSFFFPENSNCFIVFSKINLSPRVFRCTAEFWIRISNDYQILAAKNLVIS